MDVAVTEVHGSNRTPRSAKEAKLFVQSCGSNSRDLGPVRYSDWKHAHQPRGRRAPLVGPSNPRIHLSPRATHARAIFDPPGRSLNCTPPDDTVQPPLLSPVSSMTAKERCEGGLGTPTTTTCRSNPSLVAFPPRNGPQRQWTMAYATDAGDGTLQSWKNFVHLDIAGR